MPRAARALSSYPPTTPTRRRTWNVWSQHLKPSWSSTPAIRTSPTRRRGSDPLSSESGVKATAHRPTIVFACVSRARLAPIQRGSEPRHDAADGFARVIPNPRQQQRLVGAQRHSCARGERGPVARLGRGGQNRLVDGSVRIGEVAHRHADDALDLALAIA